MSKKRTLGGTLLVLILFFVFKYIEHGTVPEAIKQVIPMGLLFVFSIFLLHTIRLKQHTNEAGKAENHANIKIKIITIVIFFLLIFVTSLIRGMGLLPTLIGSVVTTVVFGLIFYFM